jgi:phosphatidylglycerol lysyltransferase
MRYHPEAPGGTMDYLFVKLMEWGESQGFHWFSLGMAPLAGLEERAMAAPWNRIASLVFRHGQHFYDFAGLRAYKEKFNPVWSPRFLAAPRGLSLPVVLMNIHTHISG